MKGAGALTQEFRERTNNADIGPARIPMIRRLNRNTGTLLEA